MYGMYFPPAQGADPNDPDPGTYWHPFAHCPHIGTGEVGFGTSHGARCPQYVGTPVTVHAPSPNPFLMPTAMDTDPPAARTVPPEPPRVIPKDQPWLRNGPTGDGYCSDCNLIVGTWRGKLIKHAGYTARENASYHPAATKWCEGSRKRPGTPPENVEESDWCQAVIPPPTPTGEFMRRFFANTITALSGDDVETDAEEGETR